MQEVFKKSTICFINEDEYDEFIESCMQRSKNFTGWEIIKEKKRIVFPEDYDHEFKITFHMMHVGLYQKRFANEQT